MSDAPKILCVDEDRAHQAPVAEAFNQAGFFYRFVSDRKKALGGLRQLRPDLLLLHGEVRSGLVEDVLAAAGSDPRFASLPIALLCSDTTDAVFLSGLRGGIVELLKKPFEPSDHVARVKAVLAELPQRSGTVVGQSGSEQLTALIEHLRRTRRSGVVTLNARTPTEGRAAFVAGKLESASMGGLSGVEALVAMVTLTRASWSFSAVGGAAGDGGGMVIEVGDTTGHEVEISLTEDPLVPLDEFEVKQAPPPAKRVAPPRSEPVRVLLVDDDLTLCQMFTRLFHKSGFAVSVAHDGVEGFEAALAGGFDAVIADLNMPRMDGWGMLRQLRDDYRTRELPVAFLSCHDDYRESLKALNAGAQAYFSKGDRLDTLISSVRELIAPRERLCAELEAGTAVSMSIGTVGAQWLLHQLARLRFTGRLDMKDGFAAYQLFFNDGRAQHAFAQAGRYSAEGDRAFNAVVSSKAAEGTLVPGTFPAPATLFLSTDELIAKAAATMNENERRLREGLLVNAKEIGINSELYAVYTQVGPKARLEAARLICEERLSPREVIARSNASPIEVEETMKDLLRRGVVTLGN
ncbi:MAG: response regulator [Myxococcaceae bacterium]